MAATNTEWMSDHQILQENLFRHIILPRFLLPYRTPNFPLEELELLQRFAENVEQLADHVPPNTLKMIRSLAKVHLNLRPSAIKEEINGLQPGETFAMFVRFQNCAIIIHMLPNAPSDSNNIIVATFLGKVHPDEVYKNPSDLEYNYPTRAIRIKNSKMLRSEEFAKQLYFLCENKLVDAHSKDYVTNWLVTTLMDQDSSTATKFPIIKKKIRDEILKTPTEYVRRSSLYMVIKALLQHNLTLELGEQPGKLMYKLIMLKFISNESDYFNQPTSESINIELAAQVLAKLARRIEKLDEIKQQKKNEKDELKELIILDTCSMIRKIRLKIDSQIKRLQNADEKESKLLPLTDLDFGNDIIQRIPNLCDYLHQRVAMPIQNVGNAQLKIMAYQRHFMTTFNPPNVLVFPTLREEISQNLYLTDFENWILYELNYPGKYSANATALRALFFAYIPYAEIFYQGDPLGQSKIVLVSLKIIQMLDSIAHWCHPLLLEHHSGINPKIINSLLLPQYQDMSIAHDLEKYFDQRNQNAFFPSLIGEVQVSNVSFAARYAERDDEMKQTLHRINLMEMESRLRKQEEVTESRKKVQELRNEAATLSHASLNRKKKCKAKSCRLCKVNAMIKNTTISVDERLLPDSRHEQNAIVFELRIPIEVACLRDVLVRFAQYIDWNVGNSTKIKGKWIDRLASFNASYGYYSFLGNTSVSVNRIQKLHVDEDFEKFTIRNYDNCVYHSLHGGILTTMTDDAIKHRCTMTVSDKYKCLQWTLNGTSHTQNEVLARQSECPHDLSLSEFKNFGSLRADGHRLQWRNLYAAIETEALSFENSSAFSLVMQLIWEAEVSGTAGVIRESHEDFQCVRFSQAFIELLNRFVEKQKANWAHPFKILTAALIAVRIFELNNDENVANQLTALLGVIRTVALDWIEKIKNAIQNDQNPNSNNQNQLRTKLVLAAVAGALTFHVHSRHQYFRKIFVENNANGFTAARIWLQFIVTLTHNSVLSHSQADELNPNMLLRMVRNTGIHIQSTVTEILKANFDDVIDFIKKHWTQSKYGYFQKAYFAANDQVLVVEVIVKAALKYVTVDLITGWFLVNSLPVCRLPDFITRNNVFRRTFENFVFEVQQDSPNSFTSVQKYNGNYYEFIGLFCGLVIIERQDDENEIELIPYDHLEGDIPPLLVERYSHWWNKNEDRIEFRPKLFKDPNFFTAKGIEYILDLRSRHLIHVKTNRNLLDITSKTYENIVRHISRLEQPRYINVVMDEPNVAKIELIRMGLKFRTDCSDQLNGTYDILSNEFSQMRVSLQQNCGTLFGLKQGLLLEDLPNDSNNKAPSKKILLLPHGKIYTIPLHQHVSVSIDFESELWTPPFHAYQVDEICRQLKPNSNGYSAWLYLAYLHAVTSHGQIEPFIGMSGTEKALQILQSGFVWSSAPYDVESIKILHAFEQLSPRRQLIGRELSVNWPTFIHPHSAQDFYVLIVKKLLGDSERLKDLYPEDKSISKEEKVKPIDVMDTDLKLNLRDYLRCLQLQPNLRVSNEFIHHTNLTTSAPKPIDTHFSSNTQTIATLYHKGSCYVPETVNLTSILVYKNSGKIQGPVQMEYVENILNNIQEIRNSSNLVHKLWISFYEVVRKSILSAEHLTLIFTLLAHHQNDTDAILALQTVAANPEKFANIDPPSVAMINLFENEFDASKILEILKKWHSYPNEYYLDWTDQERQNYDDKVELSILDLGEAITEEWPCKSVALDNIYYTHWDISDTEDINIQKANSEINALLAQWNSNFEIQIFIERVTAKLHSLTSAQSNLQPKLKEYVSPAERNWPKYEIDLKKKISQSLDEHVFVTETAQYVWETKGLTDENSTYVSTADWFMCYEKIVHSDKWSHLIDAGLCPRNVPTVILPMLTSAVTDRRLKAVIGAWALSMAKEQRLNRILTYSGQPQLKPALDRELENEPHVNWKPHEYAEWLLFEIEQNLTIRRIQVEIAKEMLNENQSESESSMDGKPKSHFTMQLNMGEGKTAVIVPILASILANGHQVCQVIVLKSLLATNLQSLRRYLGGMLGRRIYLFPCRRDLPMDKCIDQIQDMYEECKRKKGIIIQLPEYCLSFQLKIYESLAKDNIESARKFLQSHKWLNENVRTILDESDAILDAKYQLIYTVGNQLQLDGGAQRWLVIQSLLKRVPHHMKELYLKHGAEKLEFNVDYVANGNVFGYPMVNYRTDVFTPCRILDESMFALLKEALIEDFLSGQTDIAFPGITTQAKESIRILLSARTVDSQIFETTLADLGVNERNILLILSGLLRFEVLKLVLTKRWRVNYGVDEKSSRKMAIPFKAKDVAATMTEYGQPDVAICLTQLSYYYSGLSDGQLLQAFKILALNQNSADIYEKWIANIAPELVDPSVQTYSGINLIDPHQRNEILFPLFRFNMEIIDFWLSHVVFSREAKSFESKLICTAWDLCSEEMHHRVTGFSGTNDTKNVLPMPIVQNDLRELEHTNENVRKTLLQPENQSYKSLPANVSAKEILKLLASSEIPVLLDAGALMLELNNKQVAEVWLKMTSEATYDAALFFDSQDVLQAIDRNGLVAEFDSSVYRENLNRCLVYLDDTHTRGTDFKFPLGWKACVTLCGGITRDKTVQACMRMRQLGRGHSIAFWASFEADINIRKTCGLTKQSEINNEHVVEFICANSRHVETENTVHWAIAAHNYTAKLAAHKWFEMAMKAGAMRKFYERCVNNEFVTLDELYGDKEDALLTDISTKKFQNLIEQYEANEKVVQFIQQYADGVTEKLLQQAKDVRRFVHSLDEEQEKELEQEVEEVRHVQRPKKSEPAKQVFDDDLVLLVQDGVLHDVRVTDHLFRKNLTIVHLEQALAKTQLYTAHKDDASPWNDRLYATKNFIQVLRTLENTSCDEFLRPVWWIARVDCISVLLSPFEVNHLLPHFRRSTKSTLFMFRPRLSKTHSDLLNEVNLQVTGKSFAETVDVHVAAQIRMFSGSMYFQNEDEQNAYCNFLGLIPSPRLEELKDAFNLRIIKPNGFVADRDALPILRKYVDHCKFMQNPIDLAIKLIEAHHGFIRKESHTAAILERGTKLRINEDDVD